MKICFKLPAILRCGFIAAFAIYLAACEGDAPMLALNSKPISLEYNARQKALKGVCEPFMLFFYAKDCGACAAQIPVLNELKNDFKIIGVLNGVRNIAQAKEESKGTEFATIYLPNDVEYLKNIVGGISGVPVMFLYDGEGKLSKRFYGQATKTELKKQINLIKLKEANGA